LTLASWIHSILDQTYSDYEILLLNDGSTDESLKIAKQFDETRVCIFSDGINRGLTYRLNQGFELACGKYIARMDSDDLCFPERFEKLVGFLNAHSDIDLLGCRAQRWPPPSRHPYSTRTEAAL